MRSVHVGVGHNHQLAVAELGHVHVVGTDAAGQGLNNGADFLMTEHFVHPGFFHVEDFSLDRQNGLKYAIPSGLCRAAGRLSFHDVKFRGFHIAAGTIREFAGQAAAGQCPFACQFTGFACRFTRLSGQYAFLDNAFGIAWMFFQPDSQCFIDGAGDKTFDFAITEFVLGLTFKLRVGNLDRYDCGKPFP